MTTCRPHTVVPFTSTSWADFRRPAPRRTSTPRPVKRSTQSFGAIAACAERTQSMTGPRSCDSGVARAADAEARGTARGVDGLRGREERLGGDAAVLEAVAAHALHGRAALGRVGQDVLFDERDARSEARAARGDDEAAGAATDDDEVVAFHPLSTGNAASRRVCSRQPAPGG